MNDSRIEGSQSILDEKTQARQQAAAPVRAWIRVYAWVYVCVNVCVCAVGVSAWQSVCVLESVRKLNFDFALMLRYGILGRSNQLLRGVASQPARPGTKGI